MTDEEVEAHLNKINNVSWISSLKYETEDEEVEWSAISELPNRITVGISRTGDWIQQRADRVIVLRNSAWLRDLLPCLEKPAKAIRASLLKGLQSKDLPPKLLETFPFEGIVCTGLLFELDYWADLALGWIEEIGLTDNITAALSTLVTAKWASQKNRHRAQKCLKKRVIRTQLGGANN